MTLDERLFAYVDGELPADERVRFEAEVASDPHLAATVQAHRNVRTRMAETYAPLLNEPVPARLMNLVKGATLPLNPRPRLPQWAAMAACLVIGLAAGRVLLSAPGPLAIRGGQLVAQGDLDHALNRQLAADSGVVKVGLSFRSIDGRYCRTFDSAEQGLAGLACLQDGRWIARMTTVVNPARVPEYRTASSDTPPALLAAVDSTISGEAFDAAAERAARDRGWKP